MRRSSDPSNQVFPVPSGLAFLRRFDFPRKLGILERLYGASLESCGSHFQGGVQVELQNGVTWRIDLTEVTHRWMVYGDYEGPMQMGWLKTWLSGGGVFVDSGANIGQMVASLSHIPGVSTFAFEPCTSERQWLSQCLARYSEWRVEIVPFGLSDERAEASLRLAGGRSTLRQDWYLTRDLEEEPIALLRLDDYLLGRGVDRVRLWKLDVEGHEVRAIKGATRLLADQCIDAILVECQAATIPSLLDELSKFGYRLYGLRRSGLVPYLELNLGSAFSGNLIALPDAEI